MHENCTRVRFLGADFSAAGSRGSSIIIYSYCRYCDRQMMRMPRNYKRIFQVAKEKEVDSLARGGSTRPANPCTELVVLCLGIPPTDRNHSLIYSHCVFVYMVYFCSLCLLDISLHSDYSSGPNNLHLCSLAVLKHNPILIPGI